MVIDVGAEIRKHGSAEQALTLALARLNGLTWQIWHLNDEIRRLGGDPNKVKIPPLY
jgi:hypothetical protein